MAKIKRGVSFYSYQQAQFFGMRWKDMVKELHDNLHCDGVEIINESTIPRYPFGTEEFFYDWDETMARYNMVPTVSNVFFDTLQFRDHVMSYEEGINRLKYDIRTAARMGFHMVRCLGSLPFEIYKGAVPEAEKYDVQIGRELHVPEGMYSPLAEELIEYVDKTGCPYLKIVVDMSCFEIATPQPNIDYAIRNADEDDKKIIELKRISLICPMTSLWLAWKKTWALVRTRPSGSCTASAIRSLPHSRKTSCTSYRI